MFKHPEIGRMGHIGALVAGHGWAEGNAGNMSVRLEGKLKAPRAARGAAAVDMKLAFPGLAGKRFLVTATGGRMRDIERLPARTLVLAEILPGGGSYRILWGSGRPTSEFICHLAVHDVCAEAHPEMRAVLHVHSPHLIALSHLSRLQTSPAFADALRRVHPEGCVLLGLAGLSFVPFMVGSTPPLAQATREALRDHELAMWSMHGLVVRATDLEGALDRAEMAERAAELYLLRLAADPKARGLSDEQVAALRAVFFPRTGR